MANTVNPATQGTPPSDVDPNFSNQSVENCDPELCIQFLNLHRDTNYDGIATRLNTSDVPWMSEFLRRDGLSVLTENLARFGERRDDEDASLKCAFCIRTVLNKGVGLKFILQKANKRLVHNILLGVQSRYTKTKIAVTEILSALAMYSPDGHQSVISALEFYKRERGQRHRFSIIIEELEKTQSSKYKLTLVVFVNSLLVKMADTAEGRQTREAFLELGILDILDKLREEECGAIVDQIDYLEHLLLHDYEEEEGFDEVDGPIGTPTDKNRNTRTGQHKADGASYKELYNSWFMDEIDAGLSSEAEAGAVFSGDSIIDDIWKRLVRET
ncbi:inverted formin-2-like [Ptychodera flava]|uniref:inverted formin-2-like n=1 Tax=Ptychodera flava TaxID=63121 RepID=UPI00396A78E1